MRQSSVDRRHKVPGFPLETFEQEQARTFVALQQSLERLVARLRHKAAEITPDYCDEVRTIFQEVQRAVQTCIAGFEFPGLAVVADPYTILPRLWSLHRTAVEAQVLVGNGRGLCEKARLTTDLTGSYWQLKQYLQAAIRGQREVLALLGAEATSRTPTSQTKLPTTCILVGKCLPVFTRANPVCLCACANSCGDTTAFSCRDHLACERASIEYTSSQHSAKGQTSISLHDSQQRTARIQLPHKQMKTTCKKTIPPASISGAVKGKTAETLTLTTDKLRREGALTLVSWKEDKA